MGDFEAAIDGDIDAQVCVVSYGEPAQRVRVALDAACAGLTMPDPVYLDVSLLVPADAFAALEGLDAVAVVVADEIAATLLSQAYRCEVVLDAQGRLFGRPCVAFSSFEADLTDERAKQRDWALLKTLRSVVRRA